MRSAVAQISGVPAVPKMTLGKHVRLNALTIRPALNGHIVEHHRMGSSAPKTMAFTDHNAMFAHLGKAIQDLKVV